MLVVCASRLLKQPIEFEISEEDYKAIEALPTPEAQQDAIAQRALRHVKKFGYDLGHCAERKCSTTYLACLDCGIRRNLSRPDWETCKNKNISYKYPTSKTTVNAIKEIKDEKIRSKLELTPQELAEARNLYITDK